MSREILVVKRNILFKDGYFQGFLDFNRKDYLYEILKNYEYVERDDAEGNPEFQQPIPYVWIINPKTKKIFAYKRANDQNYNDQRLRNKWSCGVGGHIDKESEDGADDPITDAMMRELKEEVVMKEYPIPKVIGYINDDSNSVGKDHFGIVAVIEINGDVKKGDEEMEHGQFYSIDELEKIFSNPKNDVETWTKISWPFVKAYLERL